MSEQRGTHCLVIGATGFQGGAVARLLADRGHPVRGLTRREEGSWPDQSGISYVQADLWDRDALLEAFDGITHASVTMPLIYDEVRVEAYAWNIAYAAQRVGVRRIVYNANTRIPADRTQVPAYETRRLVESVLRISGVPLVVLRPPVYLDNLFSPWNGPAIALQGVLAYPLPARLKVAWMSHRELAEATACALFGYDLDGRTFDIGGQRLVNGHQLAEQFTRALGRPVHYEALPPEVFEADLAGIIGARAAAGVASSYHHLSGGGHPDLLAGDPAGAARELGYEPRPIADWVASQPWQTWSNGPVSA